MSSFHPAIRSLLGLLAIAMAGLPGLAAAQSGQDWSTLEQEDLRLAGVADRIMIANAHLCTETMPVTGLILHSEDQYREGVAETRFADGPVAILAVVRGSPADRAGLQADDAILAINGQPTSALSATGEGNLRETVFALLADQPASSELRLSVARDGARREFAVQPEPGCRSLVEVLVGDGPEARSDGRVIQVQHQFSARLNEEQLAVVFAHELAHTVLQHRRRKEEAGIDNGLFAEFGRNQQANRQAEVEADRLSVHLLANAGYDPATIPAFWRAASQFGLGGGIIPSFVYPSSDARAELIEREIAMYLPLGRGPSWPGHLLPMRESAFTAD